CDVEGAAYFPCVLDVHLVLFAGEGAENRSALRQEITFEIVIIVSGNLGKQAEDVGHQAPVSGATWRIGNHEIRSAAQQVIGVGVRVAERVSGVGTAVVANET